MWWLDTVSVFSRSVAANALARFSEIHLLEVLAILVALRLWGHLWAGCRIQVFCDNLVPHSLS